MSVASSSPKTSGSMRRARRWERDKGGGEARAGESLKVLLEQILQATVSITGLLAHKHYKSHLAASCLLSTWALRPDLHPGQAGC